MMFIPGGRPIGREPPLRKQSRFYGTLFLSTRERLREAQALNRMPDAVPGGDKLALPAGRDPNEKGAK
jgi:hypothetical protein